MKYVIDLDPPGGKSVDADFLYSEFISNCGDALKKLRQNHRLFVNMFSLMVPARMPELLKEGDIEYMIQNFNLTKLDKEIDKMLKEQMHKSLTDKYRPIDDKIHYHKHGP